MVVSSTRGSPGPRFMAAALLRPDLPQMYPQGDARLQANKHLRPDNDYSPPVRLRTPADTRPHQCRDR
jgi:hypothetical protein